MEKKISKILLINYEYPPLGGGGGVAAEKLVSEWSKKAEVHVLTSSFKKLPRYENKGNVSIYRVPVLFRKSRDTANFISMFSYLVTGFFRGLKLMKKNRYDIINTHFAVPSGPLGYILGKTFKVKNILSLHGGDIYDPSKKMSPHNSLVFKRIVKFILLKADLLVAQSTNTKNNALQLYKVNRYIHIIPLPFEKPEIKPASRNSLHLKQNDFIIISIGRLIKRKAFDDAIRAVSRVDQKNVKLMILGEGPEREYLESVIAECNAQDRVTLVGYVEEEAKYNYIKNANLMLMSSLHEGFGIIFMEAMFYGLPIVCSNNGGQIDFLKNEKNALLCNVGDIDEYTRNVTRYISDKALYKKCSKNNKQDIKNYYSDAIADQYMNIFNKVVYGEAG